MTEAPRQPCAPAFQLDEDALFRELEGAESAGEPATVLVRFLEAIAAARGEALVI